MPPNDQVTSTDRNNQQNSGLSNERMKTLFQFLSSLLLPLMLGVFTVVITFQQQATARQQCLEDRNDSRLQREQELIIARYQREQELKIAEMQRETQKNSMKDQYRDQVLVAYFKEIGKMLKEENRSLTANWLSSTRARGKTLNTIRQLDGPRNSQIIRFLYEAGQLTATNESVPLDISTAELINITKGVFQTFSTVGRISFSGTLIKKCTFDEDSL
jgi:hypothetical protein